MHLNLLGKPANENARSVKARKNIVASAFIKGADTLVYLLLVPLTLGYLNAYEYGIWLTLNSILAWINSFDIGLGSGLRNMLGIAIAEGDKEKGRCFVSTTFVMLIFIVSIIFIIGSLCINGINWYSLLNVNPNSVGNIKEIVLVSFLFFCINFILRFIGNVYQALQLPAVNYLISFSGHLLSLIVIFIFTKTVKGSLFCVAVVYSAAPPLVYLLCYPITFFKLFPYLTPSFKLFRKEYLKDLLSLSVLFFIIQVMGIVLFSLTNILISHMFGPDQVTPYNIAYRYFSVLLMFFNLLLAPMWSASTDAYAKGDIEWINNSLNKLKIIMFGVFVIVAVMIAISNIVYRIWIGTAVSIPIDLSLLTGVYIFIILYSLSFSSILNGMGKLAIQTLNIVGVGIAFYPICYLLGEKFGVTGIVMGMCFVNIPGAILNRIQLNKILKGVSGNSLWNK